MSKIEKEPMIEELTKALNATDEIDAISPQDGGVKSFSSVLIRSFIEYINKQPVIE